MNTDSRLSTWPESEKYLIGCVVAYSDEASDIVPQVEPTDFVDPLHQKLWRTFKRQLLTVGVNVAAAGKEHDCSLYLLEAGQDAVTIVHVAMHAERVCEAARARRVYDVAHKAADAILRGRTADAVLASLDMALQAFEQEASAA